MACHPMLAGQVMGMEDPDNADETGVHVLRWLSTILTLIVHHARHCACPFFFAGNLVSWFFAGCALLATLLWGAVHCLEGSRSAIELPASALQDTQESDINAAALMGVHLTDWEQWARDNTGSPGEKESSAAAIVNPNPKKLIL